MQQTNKQTNKQKKKKRFWKHMYTNALYNYSFHYIMTEFYFVYLFKETKHIKHKTCSWFVIESKQYLPVSWEMDYSCIGNIAVLTFVLSTEKNNVC